jgi:1,4-dihydroxy-2-naphthoate octaprenyltransferase
MGPRRLAIVSVVLIVVGAAIAAIFSATALDAVGITIAGIGSVGIVSAAFYAVGESEDRDRERDRRGRDNGHAPR